MSNTSVSNTQAGSFRQVQAKIERVYAITNHTFNNISGVISIKDGGGTGSVKIESIISTVVVKVNEKIHLFKYLLFALPVIYISVKPIYLTLGSITNEVKELFASASTTSYQARLVSDEMYNLTEDVSLERSYLSQASRFP